MKNEIIVAQSRRLCAAMRNLELPLHPRGKISPDPFQKEIQININGNGLPMGGFFIFHYILGCGVLLGGYYGVSVTERYSANSASQTLCCS